MVASIAFLLRLLISSSTVVVNKHNYHVTDLVTSSVVKPKPATLVFPLIFDHVLLRELLTL